MVTPVRGFVYARANSCKNYQTPISIIRQRDPSINPSVGMLQPVFLELLLPKPHNPTLSSSPPEGCHVPSLVCRLLGLNGPVKPARMIRLAACSNSLPLPGHG